MRRSLWVLTVSAALLAANITSEHRKCENVAFMVKDLTEYLPVVVLV
jgi:hypothetical protein